MRRGSWFALLLAVFAAALTGSAAASGGGATDVAAFGWTKLTGTPGWTGRAGLQAAELRNTLFVMGGRTPAPSAFDPFGSILWNDVWASRDAGTSWSKVTDAPWAARAYFQTVTLRGAMIVIGGQNFTVAPNPACSFGPVGRSVHRSSRRSSRRPRSSRTSGARPTGRGGLASPTRPRSAAGPASRRSCSRDGSTCSAVAGETTSRSEGRGACSSTTSGVPATGRSGRA